MGVREKNEQTAKHWVDEMSNNGDQIFCVLGVNPTFDVTVLSDPELYAPLQLAQILEDLSQKIKLEYQNHN